MDRVRSLCFLFAALGLTGLIAVGCDSGTQEPSAPDPESAAGSQAEGSTAVVEIEEVVPDDIDSARFPELPEGVVRAVPDNFPDDVPIYPGSRAAKGKGIVDDGQPMSAVQLLSNDPPTKVFDFYRDQLESTGWTIGETRDLGDNNAIQATKGDCRSSLLISPAAGGGSDIYIITSC